MKVYESYAKTTNGKWGFTGITNEKHYHEQDNFLIHEKTARGFIYRTFKFLNGEIETYRYKEIL